MIANWMSARPVPTFCLEAAVKPTMAYVPVLATKLTLCGWALEESSLTETAPELYPPPPKFFSREPGLASMLRVSVQVTGEHVSAAASEASVSATSVSATKIFNIVCERNRTTISQESLN
jgi:hypothetical protein